MRVVKVGGSIEKQGRLDACLERIRELPPAPTVIVPGGGAFADLVRQTQQIWNFNDRIAHRMAILAMQQMALLLHALQPHWPLYSTPTDLALTQGIAVWSPDIALLDVHPIPSTWSVTSDSLSAWLATQLNAAELWIIKSAPCSASTDAMHHVQTGVLDSAFLNYYFPERTALQVMNLDDFISET